MVATFELLQYHAHFLHLWGNSDRQSSGMSLPVFDLNPSSK
jgi:hypothetical protein